MSIEIGESFTRAASKLPFHPDRLNSLLTEGRTIPISMELDLSYVCGDKCEYCHFAYTHVKGVRDEQGEYDSKKIMTPEIANVVFKKLSQGGVKSVVFSGGGEPLDSPLALNIMKIAKECNLQMGLYTRGFNLRGELGEFIAKNFEWVVVSLDVSNGEDHLKVKRTSKSTFERKIENIKNFIETPERHSDLSLSLMVGPEHLDLVEPYPSQISFFGENRKVTKLERDTHWMLGLNVDQVMLRPIIDTGTYQEQIEAHHMSGMAYKTNEEAWKDHYKWIPQVLQILKDYQHLKGLNVSIDKFVDLYEGHSGYSTCDAMFVSAGLIGTDGTVYKCVNTRAITPIGDLKTQSIKDIYFNPNLDTAVDSGCRAGCRGCKVNKAMQEIRIAKHLNFI